MTKHQNQSKAIIAALVGIVALGIGFATVTTVNLKINGESTVTRADFNVHFNELNSSSTSRARIGYCKTTKGDSTPRTCSGTSYTASSVEEGSGDDAGFYIYTSKDVEVKTKLSTDKLTYTIKALHLQIDEQAKVTLEITNDSPSYALFTSLTPTITGATDYIKYNLKFDNNFELIKKAPSAAINGNTYDTSNYYLKPNTTGTVIVTIDAVNQSAAEDKIASLDVSFQADPYDIDPSITD